MADLHNLGSYNTLEEVWKLLPYGGCPGDYVYIAGEQIYWNEYRNVWGNPDAAVSTDPTQTINGDLTVTKDLTVGERTLGNTAKYNSLEVDNILINSDPFAAKDHDHDLTYSKIGHLHDYAPKSHRHNVGDIDGLGEVQGGGNVDIVTDYDTDIPSNSNIPSMLRLLKELSENNEALAEMLLRKDQPDTAAKVITFIEGLISKGLITAESGIKLPSGAALYSLYENGLLSFSMDENGFVIYEKGTANKWSVITSNGAEFQNLVIKFLAQITDLEVLNKATTLDLVVQALAKTYNLTVDNTADIMHGIIREYLTSESFVSGFLGSGFKIWKDANGDWNGEFDKLTVRKIFTIFELVVQKVVHQGGQVIRSAAGGKLVKVTDGGSYWKCEHDSTDDFLLDDQVLCQTFTGTSIKRYWRKVTSAGAGYFNLSKTDCEAGSANPEVGDNVAVLGNRTNTDRQSAQIDCAVGVDAPYRDDYAGINSYSLAGKLINRTGNLSGITDPDFGVLSGSGLIGMNAYLKGVFRLKSSGKLVEDAISDAQSESNAYTDGKITTVETNFEIREGQISSKVTQATTAATQASGYATSASGSASTASTKASEATGSASTATTKATAASNSANAAAGSATAAQDAADDAATILSQVTTKESSINQTASNITLQVSEVTTKVTTATNAANTATTKAGEASTSATNAANSANQASDILTTVTSKETSINQTAQAIELKAVRAESAAGRAESAEASINLKADGIVLQASNQAAQTAVNGVQIGGRNLLRNSLINSPTWPEITSSVRRFSVVLAQDIIAGKEYCFSFYAAAANAGDFLYLTLTNEIGNWDFRYTAVVYPSDTNYHIYSGTTRASINIAAGNVLGFYQESGSKSCAVKWVMLVEGNKATDWTPAPEDVTSDAQTKANAAQMAAQQYAENYANNNFTAKTTYNADLTILSNQISSKVSRTDFDALGLRVSSAETSISQQASQIALKASQSDLTAIGDRVSSAEAKITPDAINLTVKSQITTAVNDVQVGARNLVKNSKGHFIANGYAAVVWLELSEYIIPGQDYILSYKSTPTTNASLSFSLTDGVYNWSNRSSFLPNQTFKGRASSNICLLVFAESGSVYTDIYDIKLEKGNKSTDWTPAPEDVDASIALRPTTEEIKSQFTIDSSGISMMGKKIALTGLITFSSLDSSTQSTINGKATTGYVDAVKSTAESALASAGTANQSIGNLQSNLGQMAYLNAVSLAKLDDTIVEGGYLKTSLIDANILIAKLLKTNSEGPRVEIAGSLIDVFGEFSSPNIRFGVNASGYAVLTYYDNNGNKLYDLGPQGIDWGSIVQPSWSTTKLTPVSALQLGDVYPDWDDVATYHQGYVAVNNITTNTGNTYYKYYSGSSPTITQEQRAQEKYLHVTNSLTSDTIQDGWYSGSVNAPMQYIGNNTGQYIKPAADGIYPNVNGVLDIDGTVKYRRLVEYKNGYATGRVVMVFWNDGEFV